MRKQIRFGKTQKSEQFNPIILFHPFFIVFIKLLYSIVSLFFSDFFLVGNDVFYNNHIGQCTFSQEFNIYFVELANANDIWNKLIDFCIRFIENYYETNRNYLKSNSFLFSFLNSGKTKYL